MFYALQTNSNMQDVSPVLFQRKVEGERVQQTLMLLNASFVILETIEDRSELSQNLVLDLILEAFSN